jgi:hypothetical protein
VPTVHVPAPRVTALAVELSRVCADALALEESELCALALLEEAAGDEEPEVLPDPLPPAIFEKAKIRTTITISQNQKRLYIGFLGLGAGA